MPTRNVTYAEFNGEETKRREISRQEHRSYAVRVDSDDWLNKAVLVRENGHDLPTADVADVADSVVGCERQMLVDQL